MGVSTDANICYGIELPEDITDGDPDYFYKHEKALYALGLKIEYHCSDDYPMYILAVKDTVIRAYRGYPQEISREDLHRPLGVDWDARIDTALMDILNIETDKKPAWLLYSWWG